MRLCLCVSFRRVSQRQNLRNDRLDLSGVDQFRDLRELGRIRMRENRRAANSAFLQLAGSAREMSVAMVPPFFITP